MLVSTLWDVEESPRAVTTWLLKAVTPYVVFVSVSMSIFIFGADIIIVALDAEKRENGLAVRTGRRGYLCGSSLISVGRASLLERFFFLILQTQKKHSRASFFLRIFAKCILGKKPVFCLFIFCQILALWYLLDLPFLFICLPIANLRQLHLRLREICCTVMILCAST